MSYIDSPKMKLQIPTVGNQPGPEYAENINTSLETIDGHDHTTGKGVPITPLGLNINSALPMNSNPLTSAQYLNINSLSSDPATTVSLYSRNGDLYFIDSLSRVVRITQSGSVAVSGAIGFTGLPSGTASASYSAGVFTFESATDINADVNMRTLRLSNNVVNSYLLTLQPPTLTVDYTITLPLKPTIAQTTPAPAPVLIDTAGNMSAGNSFDYILPPGVIMPYAANSIPTGWLLCDGGAVSRTTYANLYALVGDAYGPGDGVNTFNVPDLRGIFPRGAGTNANATIVAGGSAGSVGTYQDDALQGHKHTDAGHSHGGYVNSTLYPGWGFAFISGGTGSYNSIANPSATANLGNPTATTYGTPRIASETRPANVTVNYIIKY